jgi:hypothetical protein
MEGRLPQSAYWSGSARWNNGPDQLITAVETGPKQKPIITLLNMARLEDGAFGVNNLRIGTCSLDKPFTHIPRHDVTMVEVMEGRGVILLRGNQSDSDLRQRDRCKLSQWAQPTSEAFAESIGGALGVANSLLALLPQRRRSSAVMTGMTEVLTVTHLLIRHLNATGRLGEGAYWKTLGSFDLQSVAHAHRAAA